MSAVISICLAVLLAPCPDFVSIRINTGGLAVRNAALMQIYADVLGRPMKVAHSDQTCALGAAMFGAVAGGAFASLQDAQAAICRTRDRIFHPNPRHHATYQELYALYSDLHDAFGTGSGPPRLDHVMKELLTIRERAPAA